MVTTTPYVLPRQTRQSEILVGNGTAGPYGPTGFKVFDTQDVEIWWKPAGATRYAKTFGTIAKTGGADSYSPVTVTFPIVVPASTTFQVLSRRLHERQIAVLKAGAIDADQLERELSKQGTVLQETRRDLDAKWGSDVGGVAGILRTGTAGKPAVYTAADVIGPGEWPSGGEGGGGGSGGPTGWVNVVDDGHIHPDTGADVYAALQAFVSANAGKIIFLPRGLWLISRALKLPSYTWLWGAGSQLTELKLTDDAPASENVITNASNNPDGARAPGADPLEANVGNAYITVKGLKVNGNRGRTLAEDDDLGSDTQGCGIGFARVFVGIVEDCLGVDCLKHCFDAGAVLYSIEGDSPTFYQPGPSQYITFRRCEATGSGDDCFTCHFSRHIYIEHCHAYDSAGSLVPTNSNGIEIDDGSYDVVVFGGTVERCVRGIEVKGHAFAPAAQRVTVIGLVCEECVRNFECRHIGHRLAGEPVSATARLVWFISCTSIRPKRRTGLAISPRHFVGHGYDTLILRDPHCIGAVDPTQPGDTEGDESLYVESFASSAVDTTANTITVLSNVVTWPTGTPLAYQAGDTAIGGLTDGQFYYAVQTSSTTVQLTATQTDAFLGVNIIDLTTQGVGTHALRKLAAPLAMGFHFNCRNVVVENPSFFGVTGVAELIRFTGSVLGTATVINVRAKDCEGIPVAISGSFPGFKLYGIDADTTVSPQPAALFRSTFNQNTMPFEYGGIRGSGYAANVLIGTPATSIYGPSLDARHNGVRLRDGRTGADYARYWSVTPDFITGVISERIDGSMTFGPWVDRYTPEHATRPYQLRLGSYTVGTGDYNAIIIDGVTRTTTIAGLSASLAATSVVNTPTAPIVATTVQAAIDELAAGKQPLDSDLTAIAALTTAAYGRSLLEAASEAAFKTAINFSALNVVEESGATKTLGTSDAGKMILLSHSSDITVTLPNSLPVNFQVTLVQAGAGPIVLDAASGATIANVSGHVESAAQWGVLALAVVQNAGGSAATYLLSGNTAA